MKKFLVPLLLPLLAGCFTASVPQVAYWAPGYIADDMTPAKAPKYGVGRVAQVTVRSPYAGDGIAVLRADGSIAFDAYNLFAAQPAQLLRGAVYDAMVQSGLFKEVVNASSIVSSDVSVEVMVTELALNCRIPETDRAAAVTLIVRIVDNGELVASGKASVSVAAKERDFGTAFSMAVSQALEGAFENLK